MTRGREAAEWGRASVIMGILWADFRAQFPKGKQPKVITPDDFNPYADKSKSELPPIGMDVLRSMFKKPKKK